MPSLNIKNFAKTAVVGAYDENATQITVDNLSRLPQPPYRATWWNEGQYPDASDDPYREIVHVISHGAGVINVIRGQEGTTASPKNIPGTTYTIEATITAGVIEDRDADRIDIGAACDWITEYGAKGNGTTDDYNAFVDALDAGITHLVIPSGTYRISTDLEIPSNVTLCFQQGATLAPDAGVTITLNGPIIAGNYQIKSGSGTVVIGPRIPLRYSRNFGGSDDSILINGKRLVFDDETPSSGSWSVGDTVLNSDPSSGEPIGWRCIASGTPGTWEPLTGANIKTVVSAEFNADSTGVQYIDVAHGETTAPEITDIMCAQFVITAGWNPSDPPYFREPLCYSVTSTQIRYLIYVMDAGASGTKAKLVVSFRKQ